MKTYTMLDTTKDYTTETFEEDLYFAGEVLEGVIDNYEARYNTTVEYVAWIGERYSQYGAIGGNGASAVAVKEYDRDNPHNAFVLGDSMTIDVETGKDGGFNLAVGDHDGTTSTQLVLLTENMLDKWGGYYRDESAEQLAPEKNPIKLSQKVIESILE